MSFPVTVYLLKNAHIICHVITQRLQSAHQISQVLEDTFSGHTVPLKECTPNKILMMMMVYKMIVMMVRMMMMIVSDKMI